MAWCRPKITTSASRIAAKVAMQAAPPMCAARSGYVAWAASSLRDMQTAQLGSPPSGRDAVDVDVAAQHPERSTVLNPLEEADAVDPALARVGGLTHALNSSTPTDWGVQNSRWKRQRIVELTNCRDAISGTVRSPTTVGIFCVARPNPSNAMAEFPARLEVSFSMCTCSFSLLYRVTCV